ncbi:hypothetical protein X943_002645 [Babesia divergens]|uniref:Splicing factor Cactin n=1 Tax=Babesia divergens TaxID=32595 RepID=A0AAD9GDE8_BABDI|nr:hypothetical protein X943_002645 [Babesia divergens]
MVGITGRGLAYGGSGTKRHAQSDADAPEERPTVAFTGDGGKVLTFVKSSGVGGPESSQQHMWKRQFVSTKETEGVSSSTKGDVGTQSPEKHGTTTACDDTAPKKRAVRADITTPLSDPYDGKGPVITDSEDYFQKEDEFMLKQEIEKSKVRLNDGRGNELDNLLTQGIPCGTTHALFKGADDATLKQYIELLNAHLHFTKDEGFAAFLEAIKTIVNIRLAGDVNNGEVSEFIAKKIDEILESKDIEQLEGYEVEIKKKLSSDEVVDANFWELTLSKIPFYKACCVIDQYKRGKLKADVVSQTNLKKGTREPAAEVDPACDKFMKSLKLEEDEQLVNDDVPYGNSSGIKPRFVVRMTTGFEWNRYNQSHYDLSNPPPKHIQGFKFNIFFSKLEDPKTTPKWDLVRDGDSKDTCLIVFKGGRPYSPIAFRIPSREWDTDPTRGFKNYISNGVLHLYFNFRKLVYRR